MTKRSASGDDADRDAEQVAAVEFDDELTIDDLVDSFLADDPDGPDTDATGDASAPPVHDLTADGDLSDLSDIPDLEFDVTPPDTSKGRARFGKGSKSKAPSSEEVLTDVVSSLEEVTAQRDDYLDLVKRVQAEFENYKRRVENQRVEQIQRAAEALVVELLPVLDGCEAALAHGADDVAPIHASLLQTLERRGLGMVNDVDADFDPEIHEAVLSEPAEDDDEGTVVVEIMRTGYRWNGRIIRPAMVKVRG